VHDLEGAAKLVIHDWNQGKIKYYAIPPNYSEMQEEVETPISKNEQSIIKNKKANNQMVMEDVTI